MLIDITNRPIEIDQVIVTTYQSGKLILGIVKDAFPDTGSIVIITVDTSRNPIEEIMTISFPSTMIAIIDYDWFVPLTNKDHEYIIKRLLPYNP
jgi:hypothetical protein